MQRIKNALRRDFGVLLLDVVAVNLAYFLALAFRVAVNNMGGIFGSPSDVPVYFSAFYRIAPIYTVLCVIVFFVFRLYGGVWRFAGINDMYRILASWVVTTLIQIVVSYLMMKSIGFSTSRMPATYYMLKGREMVITVLKVIIASSVSCIIPRCIFWLHPINKYMTLICSMLIGVNV